MAQPSPWIIEVTEETFEQDVLQRSQEVPVIVDFWATWCGPCQELGPVLESLARQSEGSFVLVKVDVDKQPGLAQAFGVQSIPHVFAVRQGQVVDQFMGAQSEVQIRAWLEKFQPSAEESLLLEARRLEESQPGAAEAKYREALEMSPQNDAIKISLARLLVAQHRDADSRELITQLEARGFLEPEAENVKAALDLRAAAAEGGGIAECRAAVAAAPDDLACKVRLADALAVAEHYTEALDLCLDVVVRGTGDIREEAKSTMVKIFQLLGPQADLTNTYRRKLATALY